MKTAKRPPSAATLIPACLKHQKLPAHIHLHERYGVLQSRQRLEHVLRTEPDMDVASRTRQTGSSVLEPLHDRATSQTTSTCASLTPIASNHRLHTPGEQGHVQHLGPRGLEHPPAEDVLLHSRT